MFPKWIQINSKDRLQLHSIWRVLSNTQSIYIYNFGYQKKNKNKAIRVFDVHIVRRLFLDYNFCEVRT